MPPRRFSRYTYTRAYQDAGGDLILTDPEPFRFKPFEDNRFHSVEEGDELWSLAHRYFPRFPRPDGLWWVIADFQPEPIHDPTLRLSPGTLLIIPSERTVEEEIFNARRRLE